jgi:phosphoglycolate phosphatase
MTKGTILFDLDGTITNSQKGIVNALRYMIEKLALPELTTPELVSFIGPPLNETLMSTFKMSATEATQAIGVFQEYYAPKGLYENELYPGMTTALVGLQAQDYQLAIATSKPEPFAQQIIEHLELTSYFTGVYGASVDESSRVKKADVITYALENLNLTPQTASIMMIGDRQNDVHGAQLNDLPAIGVSYGFGSIPELKKAGAVTIVTTPEELITAIPEHLKRVRH